MTDEERQRQMDFIVNTLARVSTRLDGLAERVEGLGERVEGIGEKVDGLAEKVDGLAAVQAQAELERKADAVRISRLEDALITFTKVSTGMYERLEGAFATVSRLSERMDERFGKHESRIEHVEDAIVILTKLLNRSGNGASGS
jgi:uncharacterized protein YoxC